MGHQVENTELMTEGRKKERVLGEESNDYYRL